MAQRSFKPGDRVRNVNPTSVYYDRIKDKIGVYQRAWDAGYTLHRPCDVIYPGVSDLYDREALAQSEHDLEVVHPDATITLCPCGCQQPIPVQTVTGRPRKYASRVCYLRVLRRKRRPAPAQPLRLCSCGCGAVIDLNAVSRSLARYASVTCRNRSKKRRETLHVASSHFLEMFQMEQASYLVDGLPMDIQPMPESSGWYGFWRRADGRWYYRHLGYNDPRPLYPRLEQETSHAG